MGCDIHAHAERRVNGKWETIPDLPVFDWRSYGLFGFLADVRNYSAVPPLAPRRGLPDDVATPDEYLGDHSFSWLSLGELRAFDYDQKFENRRVTREIKPGLISGGVTGDPGEGEVTTYRDFLGPAFFEELEKLKAAGAERIVFGFDS